MSNYTQTEQLKKALEKIEEEIDEIEDAKIDLYDRKKKLKKELNSLDQDSLEDLIKGFLYLNNNDNLKAIKEADQEEIDELPVYWQGLLKTLLENNI